MSFKLEHLLPTKINILSIRQIARRWSRRRAFQVALNRAYSTCAGHYPEWVAALFDEYFLTHEAVPILARYLEDGTRPNPAELANAWAGQMAWFKEETRQSRIAELVPVASQFLDWLEVELGKQPGFQPDLDSQAGEAIGEPAAQTA